jgi:hypothetical protein
MQAVSGAEHAWPSIAPPSEEAHAAKPEAAQSVNGGVPQYPSRVHTACPVGSHAKDLSGPASDMLLAQDTNGASQGSAAVPPSNEGQTTLPQDVARPWPQLPLNDHTAGAAGTAPSSALVLPPQAITAT